MAEITTGDLLQLQTAITTTVSREIGDVRGDLAEIKAEQKEQRDRTTNHGLKLAQLEGKLEAHAGAAARSAWRTLTPKQRASVIAALLTAGGAFLTDVGRAAAALVPLVVTKGHP